MSHALDEQYFTWLYGQVGSVKTRDRSRTHWSLLRQLFTKEFVWIVPNDDNRVEDGRDLRYEFIDQCDVEEVDPGWLGLGCSMLELLIGLARRLAFETEGKAPVWFWHLIETMDLMYYNDKTYDDAARPDINDKLDDIIWRRYLPDGKGGLFPLRNPEHDQRYVELWYQCNAYLLELN